MRTWEDLAKHASVLQKSVDELLKRHSTLQSFYDAQEWDNDTGVVIDLLQKYEKELSGFCEEQQSKLERLKQERSQSPFLKKVFSSRSDNAQANEYIKKTEEAIQGIAIGIELLYAMMDKTPSNKSEQKEIASELKQLKKDLTLQKREVNESMRQIRSDARQKAASWTGVNSGFLGGVARLQRTSIRLEKEKAVVPNENMKAFFEKQLIALEKDLSWVLHFRGDEKKDATQSSQSVEISENVRHCTYCGRRVTTSDVCLGCGATIY
jgi:hypothetical protein